MPYKIEKKVPKAKPSPDARRNRKVNLTISKELLDKVNAYGGRENVNANVRVVLDAGLKYGKSYSDADLEATVRFAIQDEMKRHVSPLAGIAYKIAYMGYMITSLLLLLIITTGKLSTAEVFDLYKQLRSKAHKALKDMDGNYTPADLERVYERIIKDKLDVDKYDI